MSEAIAVIIAYLIGSIPTAYLVARFAVRDDIRRLGGGNVGGLNTFYAVGRGWGVTVALLDLAKGAAAATVAYCLLAVSPVWVMLAGLAAVAGHMYMVFLRFSGGKGMASAFGAIAFILTVYGYGWVFPVLVGIILIPLAATRNIALSLGICLACLPLVIWLTTGSGYAVIISVALGILSAVRFAPTARRSWREQGGSLRGFVFGSDPDKKKRCDRP